MNKKSVNNDYPLIPMDEITDEARKIAVRWGDEYFPGIAMMEKHKLASDIQNYARRNPPQPIASAYKDVEQQDIPMQKKFDTLAIVDILNDWANINNRETISRKHFLEIAKLISQSPKEEKES